MNKGLKGKFQNKKGFTLVEMLIVVAIIAILIAVSIPLVSNSLEKARDATDQANERAAKAEAALVYLGVTDATTTTGTFYYDAPDGKLVSDADEAKNIGAYGQCTGKTGDTYSTVKHTEAIIKAEISEDGVITISWVKASDLTALS